MIAVLIPNHRNLALGRCAEQAVRATIGQLDHLIWRLHGQSWPDPHGEKLDAAIAHLPRDVTHVVTMDDDAAPMRPGWYHWIRERMGSTPVAAFWKSPRGCAHPLGAVYRLDWLRDTRASFRVREAIAGFYDVGESIPPPPGTFFAEPAPVEARPWWLKRADVAMDDDGRIVWAHLGGGTIGATSWRIPTWAWPSLVRGYLERQEQAAA